MEYEVIKNKVISTLGENTFKNILQFAKNENLSLWGEQKPRNFLEINLVLTIYKDLTGMGYNNIINNISLNFNLNHKSFQHNAKSLRVVLAKWGKSTIQLGMIQDWKAAVRDVDLDPLLTNACLWMDSSDFPKQRRGKTSRKDPDWSYKLNRPGRRYMFLRDGKGTIRKIWGGYSPKVYDGDFVELFAEWFEENLANAGVIADQHFEWGKKHLKKVHFFTPIKRPPTGKRKRKDKIVKLTHAEEAYNKAIRNARARMENVFGIIKGMFHSLQQPWAEEDEQLDYLVKFAVGVYNSKIK